MADKVTVYVKAAPSRRRHGGIWRSGFFFTVDKFHEVEVDEDELDRIESDTNLIVQHERPDDEELSDDTIQAASKFKNAKTMAESLLTSDPEDEDEGYDPDGEPDEEEDEPATDAEKLLKTQPRTRRPASAVDDGDQTKRRSARRVKQEPAGAPDTSADQSGETSSPIPPDTNSAPPGNDSGSPASAPNTTPDGPAPSEGSGDEPEGDSNDDALAALGLD